MAYLLIAMCFFIVKLELNESKQTVEKIKNLSINKYL